MASRRKAVKVRSAGPGRRARLAALGRAIWPPILKWVLPSLALVAVCVAGLLWSRNAVATSTRHRVIAPEHDLAQMGVNDWGADIAKEIDRCVAFADGRSILDETLPQEVANAYHRSPWVKQVHSVQKRYPNQLHARLDLRRPAAAVTFRSSLGTRYYLVGDDGVCLPRSYTTWPARLSKRIPVVRGVRGAPPPAGQRWNDPAVLSALRVVAVLKSSPVITRRFHFVEVDVRNFGGRRDPKLSEINVITQNNCVIEWGRAPGSDAPGELPVPEKIAKLERFLKDPENPTENRTLNLRFAGPVVVSRRYGRNGERS
jgi:hypothetical protein